MGDLEKSVYRLLTSEAPMDNLKVDALAERIERLARENLRWRWGQETTLRTAAEG
jgi:hypothetical protein